MRNIIRCNYTIVVIKHCCAEFVVSTSLTPFATSVGSLCSGCPIHSSNIFVFRFSFLPHVTDNSVSLVKRNGQTAELNSLSQNKIEMVLQWFSSKYLLTVFSWQIHIRGYELRVSWQNLSTKPTYEFLLRSPDNQDSLSQ